MTSEGSSSTKTSSSWPSEALLALVLVAGSLAVYFYRSEIADDRRVILGLVLLGFFFAPITERPLRMWAWALGVALVSWCGERAGAGVGGVWLWLVCSAAGAVLVLRGGGRAATHYLPGAQGDEGIAQRRTIHRQLRIAVVLFAATFVLDGVSMERTASVAYVRAAVLLLAAVFFLRFFLFQSKYLSLTSVAPLATEEAKGLVPSQRWPVLALLLFVGATPWPDTWLERRGLGTLLVTSALLLVLAGLVFVVALVRLQKHHGWPRARVRRASFLAGIALAVALAAVVVELEAWGPTRFTSFATLWTGALIVLPFAHATTRLFGDYPSVSRLMAPSFFSVMLAPVAAIHGDRWSLTSSAFLFAFALVMVAYYLVVTVRAAAAGRAYLVASIAALLGILVMDGTAWSETGAAWKIFTLAFGTVLYSVDLSDRS